MVYVHGHMEIAKLPPHNALCFMHITNLVKFIQNYAEQNAILLPGRIPGYKRDDIKLLPSSESKKVKLTYYVSGHLYRKATSL